LEVRYVWDQDESGQSRGGQGLASACQAAPSCCNGALISEGSDDEWDDNHDDGEREERGTRRGIT